MLTTLFALSKCVLIGGFISHINEVPSSLDTPASLSPLVISLDAPDWLVARDPDNIGCKEQWWQEPKPDAKRIRVPGIFQEVFPNYHGLVWYWRDFHCPVNPHSQGRYLLRFWMVDYMADVWLNGVHIGTHEGGEEPFVFDISSAVKPGTKNRIAVRVLNPTVKPIDGIELAHIPHRNKVEPLTVGSTYNFGGIVDSVELLLVPAVRVKDLYVLPHWKTGEISVRCNLRSELPEATPCRLLLTVAPAATGETLDSAVVERVVPQGDTLIEAKLKVLQPRLWNLNDPYLYRVTAKVNIKGHDSFDEFSTRCGFRDFRFEKGYFRLNGRRIFLRSSHSGNEGPVGIRVPLDPDVLRRDLLNCKVMGFNMIRFFCMVPHRYQLDLCDEIGLLVYEESLAGWCLGDSPKIQERFERSIQGMICRDRNHPCVVIWGLLNENPGDAAFRCASLSLPFIRKLDNTRMVMLNSGGSHYISSFPQLPVSIGSFSNPGSTQWSNDLLDEHPYMPSPHNAQQVRRLSEYNPGKPVFVSEYGICSAIDLIRVVLHYEQIGHLDCPQGQLYLGNLKKFMADWERWKMADTFASPEDYFRQCLARMPSQRTIGLNAIRANPACVGYSMTGTYDHGLTGEGATASEFRDLKPGATDALFDGFYPLRFCLFVEPSNLYRGSKVSLKAVLANEDALLPGKYPVRFQVVGPNCLRLLDEVVDVKISDPLISPEPPWAITIFSRELVIDGPSGDYRFLAAFQGGGAASGGVVQFYVTDPDDMPPVRTEVVRWGEDLGLDKWLVDHGIKFTTFVADQQKNREVILVGEKAPSDSLAWRALAEHIARGSTAIFLCPSVFVKGNHLTGWVPLVNKGQLHIKADWLYPHDSWAKKHPIFDGLPSGGLMDHVFYRELISDRRWMDLDPPEEAVAAAINTSFGYDAGLLVSVHRLGEGRFILNTLKIRENLGQTPVAERLLRNLLCFAARGNNDPLRNLPADFDKQLNAIGY